MSSPLVSVVIPTFNRPVLLLETLRSILAQTHRELDVIVVDNHSAYDVATTVASLGDSRIRLFQIHNGGFIGASRNLGIGKAEGSLVAFCDDDDLWETNKIAAQLAVWDDACYAAVATRAMYFGDVSWYRKAAACPTGEVPFKDLLLKGTPVLSSLLLPTSVARFAEEKALQHVEDFDLLLKVTEGGKPVRILAEPLVRYRVHGGNETKDFNKMLNALNVLERFRPKMSPDVYRQARGRLNEIYGVLALRSGRPAGGYFLRAIKDRPRPRTLLAWIVSQFPRGVKEKALSLYYRICQKKSGVKRGE